MLNKCTGFILAGLLAFTVFSAGCDTDKKDDESDTLSFLLASLMDIGSVSFTDGTIYVWKSAGFTDPGGGYQEIATPTSGTGQFAITLTGGHTSGATYNQDNLSIVYIDTSGDTWENVHEQTFTLTIYTWPGAGGKASGIFSGTLRKVADTPLKVISNGAFSVKILD